MLILFLKTKTHAHSIDFNLIFQLIHLNITHCYKTSADDFFSLCLCLLKKYFLTHCTNFDETQMGLCQQLINLYSKPNSRWLPQSANLRNKKEITPTQSILQILS